MQPQIIEQTAEYAVVYKPPKMHCAKNSTQKNVEGAQTETLIDWFENNDHKTDLPDSGLMHRLDFETHGLVLFARTKKSFDFFKAQQDEGKFVKEYAAVCNENSNKLDGFPAPPIFNIDHKATIEKPLIIMSYFRPYGPGRKEVRPVTEIRKINKEVAKDKGGFYRTEIINIDKQAEGETVFTVRIRRGFRHQIRCHLCWIGFPIIGDPLYGNDCSDNLALNAQALFFIDPKTQTQREYRLTI